MPGISVADCASAIIATRSQCVILLLCERQTAEQPSNHPIKPDTSADSPVRRRASPPVAKLTGGSYLGELRDLLAHLAVHLVVVQLLLDVRELCRSPVNGRARPGGLCSLTGARSHNEPLSLEVVEGGAPQTGG